MWWKSFFSNWNVSLYGLISLIMYSNWPDCSGNFKITLELSAVKIIRVGYWWNISPTSSFINKRLSSCHSPRPLHHHYQIHSFPYLRESLNVERLLNADGVRDKRSVTPPNANRIDAQLLSYVEVPRSRLETPVLEGVHRAPSSGSNSLFVGIFSPCHAFVEMRGGMIRASTRFNKWRVKQLTRFESSRWTTRTTCHR